MNNGVYTALITPFNEDGSVDVEGLKVLIKRQIQAKVSGIVILGSTGEAATITTAEKELIIDIARQLIKPPILCIVGTGTNSTQTTIEQTKLAEELGADAALITTPYYNKPTQDGLFLHFEAIAKSTDLPLILYNVPSRTGTNLLPSTVKRLVEIPQIQAIKESSGNLVQIMDIIESVSSNHPSFKIFSGDDQLTFPVLALGGHGIISVVSNLIPEILCDLYRMTKALDFERARKLHYDLSPLYRAIAIETNPIPIKTLMQFQGLPSGPFRLPLCRMSQDNEKKLRHIHETLKLPLLAHD